MRRATVPPDRRHSCTHVTLRWTAFIVLGLATTAAALQGRALSLSGHGAYMEVADTPALHAAQELTLTAWFRVDGTHPWTTLFYKGDLPEVHGNHNREFSLFHNSHGYLHLSATPASRARIGHLYLDTPRSIVNPGQWYHVAAVISSASNSMQIYINGEPQAIRQFDPSGFRDSSGPLRLGTIDGNHNFQGLIDEAHIWNRALSTHEIRLNMNLAIAGPLPGLIASYRFEGLNAEGLIPDLSGHGHHGRLVGDAQLKTIDILMPPVAAGAIPENYAAAGASAYTGLNNATFLLIQALGHEDEQVRHKAVHTLYKLSAPAFVPVLTFALQSDDEYVRHHAASALASRDPDDWLTSWTDEIERDVMVVSGRTVAAITDAVNAAVEQRRAAAKPQPPPEQAWDSDRYLDWERKWSAQWSGEWPDYWDSDFEGLVARYNRVEGLYAGWTMPLEYHGKTGLAHYGEVGYALGSDDWQYRIAGELYNFHGLPHENSNLVTFGVDVHDVVDTQDGWLVSHEENSIDAVLFRRDYRDHYRRYGVSAYSSHNIGGILQVTGRYSRDEFESLGNAVGWVLLDTRFARDEFRPNPRVSEGIISSARLDVQMDTRDLRGKHHGHHSHHGPDQGWLINGLFERAGGVFEGDHRFKRYLLDLRRYQPASLGTRLDLRLRTGTAKGDLPDQYRYDLGGFSSLRGYDFKQFTGDRMILINLEYWIDADHHWGADVPVDDLGVGVFFDAGSAWFADDRSDPFEGVQGLVDTGSRANEPELKRSFGFGLGTVDQSFRVDIARPLDDEDESWRFLARFSRTF